ncbi:alpha-galactosidase [Nocardioides massiliensis]|uniref:alpha-galactosidase n=1 Tax=Nocardioides massiliensis TaxID=1325935 RepID=UPI00082D17EC|nr:alpha-galactosidase [Nocardioides massiliensis]
MIEHRDGTFYLQTAHTSYWFAVTEHGHLEHIHYGPRLAIQDPSALRWSRVARGGSTVAYAPEDVRYSLDTLPLEFSGIGQGDYRTSPCEIRTAHVGYDLDLGYRGHEVHAGSLAARTLPTAHGTPAEATTLVIDLADERAGIEVALHYTVFAAADVITRRVVVRNTGPAEVVVEKLLSFQLDLPEASLGGAPRLITFDGAWIAETHAHDRPIGPGFSGVSSSTGSSSNRHNPGFLLAAADADEDHGRVHGFNLVYSGNHLGSVERGATGLLRVAGGINPQGFSWPLAPGEEFETPEAVLAFADTGFNGLSERMHRFVVDHVLPARYRRTPRPVAYNSWEALSFDVSERRLLKQARRAADLGMELFVVDDGWFAGRKDDTAGLGDYAVDDAKFPRGLGSLVTKLSALGLQAGIWVEPEMVNEDSELYRTHPEWALRIPGKPARLGRQQHVLDLCNPDVCDYVVASVGALLDAHDFRYVKWDMNRHLADTHSPHVRAPGMTAHQYVANLHDVLRRIFEPRPHVLLETCSSGGNRFDLAMLAHSAMIWASDDTDPIERLEIQQGLSYLYPLSTISAHISNAPHQQTLRNTPLSTRFNVACFGVLGYEYDLELLSSEERKEVREQIAFYRTHRDLFQHGRFRRHTKPHPDRFVWQVDDGDRTILGNFQRRVVAAPAPDLLPVAGLEPETTYRVRSKPQRLMIDRFGDLINHVTPIRLDPRGVVLSTAAKFTSLTDAAEEYVGTGALLAQGIRLHHQFSGTEYHPGIRMLGDHGSTLYVVERLEEGP